jgi:hypothetical protein
LKEGKEYEKTIVGKPQIRDTNHYNFSSHKAEENKHSRFDDETEEVKNKYH